MPNVKKVALIVETSKSFGRGLLLSISRYAHLHGDWTLYVEERGLDDPVPRWLTSGDHDGIILRTRDRAPMEEILDWQIPTVCVGEDNPSGANAVNNDEQVAAVMAAEHFFERGFHHLAYVGIRGYIWSDQRRDAFVQRIEQSGHEVALLEPMQKSPRAPRWEPVRKRLANWLTTLPKPIGIFCCYDAMARGILDVCRELELSVPEQVAVLGVDNDAVLCEVSAPPLSSIALDTRKIGFEAAEMLDRLMHGNPVTTPVVVPPRSIVTRHSTDTLAIEDRHVAVALAYIRRHACDGIEAADVVASVPLSRRTLERRFQDQVGISLLSEINRVRLERVKQFLLETDLKLDTIAARSGFSYTSYMAAQFRRRFGRTPGEFRRSGG